MENGVGIVRERPCGRRVSSTVTFILWCGWGWVGCGLYPAWRQGWRGPLLLIAGVLASFALLFSSALALELVGIPLTRGPWLGAMTALALLASLLPRRPPPAGRDRPPGPPANPWLLAALATAASLALAVIAYRAIAQPLTGPDTIFRWNFLARQILHQGGMGFYPAVTAANFARYMWPDSIPPLLSLLYVWSYLGAGSTAAAVTAPIVILVAVLGFFMVSLLATRRAGRAAGIWAVAILAGSAVHSWSVSMGQETGLTTLGILALAWAMGDETSAPDWRLAGLAAGVTALSRDYGLAVVLVSTGWLVWRRRPWRELAGFTTLTVVLLVPWYARAWVRTGNPFGNFNLFDWFPVNEMLAALLRYCAQEYGFRGHVMERLGELAPLLWPLGAGVLLTALAGSRVRQAWPVSLRWLAALWLAVWMWSVSYTPGGLSYSLRVLSPLLALLAVAGGVALTQVRGATRGILAAGLVLLAAEASGRALVMMRMPLSVPPRDWVRIGTVFSAQNGDAGHDRAAAIIGTHRVLVDDAYAHAYLVNRGVKAMPPWSPDLDFLRAPEVDMTSTVHRLKLAGVDYIWLTASRDIRAYLAPFPFFNELSPWLRPVLSGNRWVLFELVEPSRPVAAPVLPKRP